MNIILFIQAQAQFNFYKLNNKTESFVMLLRFKGRQPSILIERSKCKEERVEEKDLYFVIKTFIKCDIQLQLKPDRNSTYFVYMLYYYIATC